MNRFLRSALLRHGSPYWDVLPYNLNWMVEGDAFLASRRFAPITVVDVGARSGLPPELHQIRHLVHHIGFDADAAESDRLNAEKHDLYARDVFPVFVGSEVGETDFHLYHRRAESSALRPNPRYAALFGGVEFGIERTVRVQTTSLDAFYAAHPELPRPDLLKLDTQGTELAVLRGAESVLATALVVEVEAEFMPMYEGQHLIHDMLAYMHERGFDLVFLNRVVAQRRTYDGWAKGQPIFGDALFARREDRLEGFDDAALQRYLVLLINYGHLDIARALVATAALSPQARDEFGRYLDRRADTPLSKRLRRKITPWVDKLILWLLHARKHNSVAFDSDRSWPTR